MKEDIVSKLIFTLYRGKDREGKEVWFCKSEDSDESWWGHTAPEAVTLAVKGLKK